MKWLKKECQGDGARCSLEVPSNGTRGHEQKLLPRNFHLDMKKDFFPVQCLSTGKDCPDRVWSLPQSGHSELPEDTSVPGVSIVLLVLRWGLGLNGRMRERRQGRRKPLM